MRKWFGVLVAVALLSSTAATNAVDAKAGNTNTSTYRLSTKTATTSSNKAYSKPDKSDDAPAPKAAAPKADDTSVNRAYSKPPAAVSPPPSVNNNYSKPPTTAAAPAPAGGGSTYTRADGRSVTGGAPVTRNALSDSVQKSASKRSLDAYDEEHRAFSQPPKAPVAPQQAAQDPLWTRNTQRWGSSDDYYDQRRRALAAEPPPPIYVQRAAPSYGMYAATFLAGAMLDRITQPSNANWAYTHQNDPSVQAWYRDMQEQAEDNADLRAKLAVYDAKMAEMKAQNAKVSDDKAALPEGVDPAAAIAPDAALAALSTRKAPGSSHWMIWSLLALAGLGVFAYFAFFRGKGGTKIVYDR